jgi:hypothetical protein
MDMLDEWFAGCWWVVGSTIEVESSVEDCFQMVKILLDKTVILRINGTF